jgi:hypothetical protein
MATDVYHCQDCGKDEPRRPEDRMGAITVRRHMEQCEWQRELQRAGERRDRYKADGSPCCISWPARCLKPCSDHANP